MRWELRVAGAVSAFVFGDAADVSTDDGHTVVVGDWTQDEVVAVLAAVADRYPCRQTAQDDDHVVLGTRRCSETGGLPWLLG